MQMIPMTYQPQRLIILIRDSVRRHCHVVGFWWKRLSGADDAKGSVTAPRSG